MSIFYIDPASGNDGNDGLQPTVLAALVNATFDFTGNGEGERHLSSSGAFSAYTFTSGDRIWLTGAAGGIVVPALYEIASKVDAGAILLVAVAGLTADSTADVDSSNGPWLTTQKAADTAVGDDEVRHMNTATETPSAQIDFDTNAGSVTAPIRFIGSDSTGAPLTSGRYTISGSSLPATTDLMKVGLSSMFLIFERIRLTAATQDNWVETGTGSGNITFRNCRIDNAADDGILNTDTSGFTKFINCEIDNNGGNGSDLNSSGRGGLAFVGCSIHDNVGDGVRLGQASPGTSVLNCLVYDNGDDGILLDPAGQVLDCTIFGNGGDGLVLATFGLQGSGNLVYNNSFSNNGGFGINDTGTTNDEELLAVDFNHYDGNISGETNFAVTPGDNNVTGDPLFTSEVDGSEDFAPLTGSPLIGAGLNGGNIGAVAHADGGGGGGGGSLIGGGLVAV